MSITFWMLFKSRKKKLMWKEGDQNLYTCILHMRVTVNDAWPQFVVIPISTVFCKMNSLPMSCIDIPIIWNILVSFLTSDRKVCILKRFCLRLHITSFFCKDQTPYQALSCSGSSKQQTRGISWRSRLSATKGLTKLKLEDSIAKEKSGVKKMD